VVSGGARARLVSLPAWVWLGAIVFASAAARAWLSRSMPAPFIFTDELAYAELARSLADSGSFAIRDLATGGYGPVYPALIAIAYVLFERLPDAYAAVKVINAVVMSLAAVPAYLIACRIAGRLPALVAAALAVAVPSMVYTSTVMTESAFYPVVLFTTWALLRVLDEPARRRTLVLVTLLVLAVLTRIQAVALVAAALTAPLLACALDGRLARLRRLRLLYGVLIGGAALVVLAQVVRGHSLRDLLGAYAVVSDSQYDVGLALRYWLWHLEELTLYVGVVPVAALLVLLVRVRDLPPRVRSHLAVTVATLFWFSLVVAVFASRHASRIQERNLFFVVPLLFGVLVVWAELRRREWFVTEASAAAGAVVLAAFFPYARFIDTPAISDTLALLPIWSSFGSLPFGSIWGTVALGGGLAALLFVFVPRRFALVVPVLLVAYLSVISASVWSDPRSRYSFQQAGVGALFQGIRGQPRDWIDTAVPEGARVGAIFTGQADRYTINVNEFFNRALGPVYFIGGRTPGNLPEAEVRIDRGGVIRRVDTGRPLTDRYVLVDSSIEVVGTVTARDAALGMTVWKVAGPVVRRADVEITGLYPGDTWSGRRVRYLRRDCDGGSIVVSLSSDQQLFGALRTTVVARDRAEVVGRVAFSAPSTPRLRVPLTPVDGVCAVDFEIPLTRNPSKVVPGSPDDRELGAHFDSFTFVPPR
jgi:Dolichyl-phosphate-mannose-protein mannosyltransferase